jgi:uncharacterized protein YjbI with pentapeptide repeats
LERLLAESTKDQRAILETLCAYIRENSPLQIPEKKADPAKSSPGKTLPSPTLRADVQAAITIIGRRPVSLIERAKKERWQLDFRNANLIGYDFSELNYDYARFANSLLISANMAGASFAGCLFESTLMTDALMKKTCFHHAVFKDCSLKGSDIEATDFSYTTLINTDLRSARVTSLSIKGANLEKAFGSYLRYSVDDVKRNGPNSINAMEVLSISQLFQKATADDATNVSEEVREAVLMMSPSNRNLQPTQSSPTTG